LDFVAAYLEIVAPDLEIVAAGLDFVRADLEFRSAARAPVRESAAVSRQAKIPLAEQGVNN
jgi:hypothetical protein